ncbi:Zn-finger domains containing protein [Halanaeroarchaeum sp. HSR-CO]|uniref:DUF7093 family protein n=1 Tax=Halanaeroarchaeum sp. HSR-CO TaxID=2866382 RepID=UPI00217DBA9D|nr:hypothetical protein [Halanaeroarchaeum sp. HSR-CO]UWG46930.1 Zn-finger domains containing protein [Halanaeroarchaeum sp. HSR-CO]
MGLRCSLLGHDYGDVVVEREQDERGSEIVVTVRELRECRRCSAESIVSENTEVRRRRPEDDRLAAGESTADEATDAAADDPERLVEEAENPASGVEEAEASVAERERANEDAIILDDSSADAVVSPDSGSESRAEAAESRPDTTEDRPEPTQDRPDTTEERPEPTQDRPDTTEERPEPTQDRPDTTEERPEPTQDRPDTAGKPAADTQSAAEADDLSDGTVDTDPAASAAERERATDDAMDRRPDTEESTDDSLVAADDAENSDGGQATGTPSTTGEEWPADSSDRDPDPEPSSGPEQWPDHPDSEADRDRSASEAAESPTGAGFQFEESSGGDEIDGSRTDPSSGIKSAGPIDLTGPPDGSLDGILHCPACGYSVAIARSSNRAGDICPDCHAGYLAEQR